MFNKELAESARARLQWAVRNYNKIQAELTEGATSLHELRTTVGTSVVTEVEDLLSELAGHPKEFDKTVQEFNTQFENFKGIAEDTARAISHAAVTGAAGTGLGIAAGAATASLAPTAAIAIATTFGTASTGTAISALSGAAATNAALAWLGGGAIAAGGGGMASGGTLLALAGPIGWGIAGVAAIGGGVFYASKNKEIAHEANYKAYKIEKGTKVLQQSTAFVKLLTSQTEAQCVGVQKLVAYFGARAQGVDHYSQLSQVQLESVGAIINHVHVLTGLMQKTVSEYLGLEEAAEEARVAAAPSWLHSRDADEQEKLDLHASEAQRVLENYCGATLA